jgi:hypothetical protein
MLTGEAAIVGCSLFTHIAFLWFNVIGTVVVVIAGLLFSLGPNDRPPIVHHPDHSVHA